DVTRARVRGSAHLQTRGRVWGGQAPAPSGDGSLIGPTPSGARCRGIGDDRRAVASGRAPAAVRAPAVLARAARAGRAGGLDRRAAVLARAGMTPVAPGGRDRVAAAGAPCRVIARARGAVALAGRRGVAAGAVLAAGRAGRVVARA